MKSEAVKLAKIERDKYLIQAVKDIITNPVLMGVAGVIAIEYLQGHDDVVNVAAINERGTKVYVPKVQRVAGGGFVGSAAGTFAEVGIIGYLSAQSLKEFGFTFDNATKVISLAKLAPGVK